MTGQPECCRHGQCRRVSRSRLPSGPYGVSIPTGILTPLLAVIPKRWAAALLTGVLVLLAACPASVARAGEPRKTVRGNQAFQKRIDAAVEQCKAYIGAHQKIDKTLLVLGEPSRIEIHITKPAGLTIAVIDASRKDAVIDAERATVKIRGRTYTSVHFYMPPGWFGPAEWIEGEPYDCVHMGGHSALMAAAMFSAGWDPSRNTQAKLALDSLLNMWSARVGNVPRGGPAELKPAKSQAKSGPAVAKPAGTPAKPASKPAEDTRFRGLDNGPMATYALGLRMVAVEYALRSVSDAATKAACLAALKRDVRCLTGGIQPVGGYSYTMTDPSGRGGPNDGYDWSLSRTQYAMLGLWSAALVSEVTVPDWVWEHFNHFLLAMQAPGGGWCYATPSDNHVSPSMTSAGIAGLWLVVDQYHSRLRGGSGPDISPLEARPLLAKTHQSIDRGMLSLESAFDPNGVAYSFYSYERVAVAAGLKYFGQRDWFRECCAELFRCYVQFPDGRVTTGRSSPDGTPLRDTAMSLLFLAHGSAPILMQKLRFGAADDPQWNNYPRDAANAARWHGRAFEQSANWQRLHLATATPEDLADAPILYATGHAPCEFTAEEVDKLRDFLEQGGTLLAVACGAKGQSGGFISSVEKLAAALYPPQEFPEFELTAVPYNHPLREQASAPRPAADGAKPAKTLPKARPLGGRVPSPPNLAELPMRHVFNGHRSLVILVEEDIAWKWQASVTYDAEANFELLANLRRYCLDRNPLPPKYRDSPDIDLTTGIERGTPRVGIVRYTSTGQVRGGSGDEVKLLPTAADWCCAPQPWHHSAEWFERIAGLKIALTRGVPLTPAEATPAKYDVLHISGHYAFTLSDAEKAALKAYAQAGGTVLFEQIGGADLNGRAPFADTAEKLLREVFADAPPVPLKVSAPLISGRGLGSGPGGFDCSAVGLSRTLAARRDARDPQLRAVMIANRPAVLLSRWDLSAAATGEAFLGREGYSPDSARRLLANILMAAIAK